MAKVKVRDKSTGKEKTITVGPGGTVSKPSSPSSGGGSSGGGSGSSGGSGSGGQTYSPDFVGPIRPQDTYSAGPPAPTLPSRRGTVPLGPSGQGSGVTYSGNTGIRRSSGGSSGGSSYNPALDSTSPSFVGPLRPQDAAQQQQGPVQQTQPNQLSNTKTLSGGSTNVSSSTSKYGQLANSPYQTAKVQETKTESTKPKTTPKSFNDRVQKPYGSFTGTQSIDPTMARYNQDIQLQRVFASEDVIKERLRKLEQEAGNIEGNVTAYSNWQNQTISQIEQKRASVDATDSKAVSDFNALINSFNIESRAKEAELGQRTSKYKQEAQVLKQDVSRFNAFQEARQKDYAKVEDKVKAYEKKFTTTTKTFTDTTPSTSSVPIYEKTDKIPLYESIPIIGGIISQRVGRQKAISDIDKAQKEFTEKWFPIADKKIKGTPSTIQKDTLKAQSIEPDVSKASVISKAGISYDNIDTANIIIGQTIASRSRQQEQSFNPYDVKQRTDKQILDEMTTKVETFKAKEVAKEQATFIGTALLTAGIGEVLPIVAKAPVAGKVIKALSSKPAQAALWGVYGVTEGTQVYSGIKDIRAGNVSLGVNKLSMVGARAGGVIFGVGALQGTGGKPISKLTEKVKYNFPSQKITVGGKDYFFTPKQMLKNAKIQSISKLDRFGNVYEGLEVLPQSGQRDMLGRLVQREPLTSAGGKLRYFGKGYETIYNKAGLDVRLVGYNIEGYGESFRFGKAIGKTKVNELGLVDIKGQKQLGDYGLGNKRWLAIDTKTNQYVEIRPNQLSQEQGQVFVKVGKQTRWASDFKGWVETDMSLANFAKSNKINAGRVSKNKVGYDVDLGFYQPKPQVTPKQIKSSQYLSQVEKNINIRNKELGIGGGNDLLQITSGKTKGISLTDQKLVDVQPKIQSVFKPKSKSISSTKTAPPKSVTINKGLTGSLSLLFLSPKLNTINPTGFSQLKQLSRTQPKFAQLKSNILGLSSVQSSATAQLVDVIPISKQATVTEQIQIQESDIISIKPKISEPIIPVPQPQTKLGGIPLFWLPPLGGGSGKRRGSYTKTQRGFRYTPSLVAQTFNITTSKSNLAALQEGTYSGLEIRPLLANGANSKPKAKKKKKRR